MYQENIELHIHIAWTLLDQRLHCIISGQETDTWRHLPARAQESAGGVIGQPRHPVGGVTLYVCDGFVTIKTDRSYTMEPHE